MSGLCTEFFLCFTWHGGNKFQPYKIIGEVQDDAFPGEWFPLFDLDQWNEDVWNKWRAIFAICARLRIIPFVRIHDYCSIKDRYHKRLYCFRTNKQRLVDGTLTGGLWGGPIKTYYHILNEKLVSTLKEAGCEKYYVVPMSEADYLKDADETEEMADRKVVEFHRWYVESLLNAGCPHDSLIISTSRAFDELKDLVPTMEIHGVNSPQAIQRVLAMEHPFPRLFGNGDGPDPDAQGRPGDKPYKKEPSVAQARDMRKLVLDHHGFGYAYYNRNLDIADTSDIKRAEFDVVRALAGKE